MASNPSGDDPTPTAFFVDMDGDAHTGGGNLYVEAASSMQWLDTNGATVKGVYSSGTVSVTVPSIGTAGLGGTVDVDVSSLTFSPAVGDQVIATPIVALPTNCYMTGAYVTATDTVRVNFQAIGGTVTGAAKNFTFLFVDLT